MRPRFNNQPQFHFQAAPALKITECCYGSGEQLAALREKIDVVAINKKSKHSKRRNSASATA